MWLDLCVSSALSPRSSSLILLVLMTLVIQLQCMSPKSQGRNFMGLVKFHIYERENKGCRIVYLIVSGMHIRVCKRKLGLASFLVQV